MNLFKKNINHLLNHCGNLKKDENLLIISDKKTFKLGRNFEAISKKKTKNVIHILSQELKYHGQEPSSFIKKNMIKSDLIISLISKSIAHSTARNLASKRGARFLSLPDYSEKLIKSNYININYKKKIDICKKIKKILDNSKTINIYSKLGTSLKLKTKNRFANACPGIVIKKGELGSPPDVEVNISPIENESHGKIIIDGSVAHKSIGKLNNPIEFDIKKGKIYKYHSQNKKYKKIINELFFNKNSKRKIIGEFGIGLNHKCKLTGNMLTDEGNLGSIHLGFGSNYTVGGKNKVNFHLDFIVKRPDVVIDNKLYLIKNGKLKIK